MQIALAGGARVIATAGTEEKREACMHLGAAVALDHRDPGLAAAIREAKGGHGVDVACDSIGGEAFGAAVEAAAFEARILPLGWSGGTPPALDASVFVARNPRSSASRGAAATRRGRAWYGTRTPASLG